MGLVKRMVLWAGGKADMAYVEFGVYDLLYWRM